MRLGILIYSFKSLFGPKCLDLLNTLLRLKLHIFCAQRMLTVQAGQEEKLWPGLVEAILGDIGS